MSPRTQPRGAQPLAARDGSHATLGMHSEPGPLERCAPWVAPIVTAGVLTLATLFMFASCGAALI